MEDRDFPGGSDLKVSDYNAEDQGIFNNIVMVFAIRQHELVTGIYVSLASWTPFPPSRPYFSGLSPSMGFGCPASCIQLALVIYFICGMHMFQCYSLKSSHPCILLMSPKVCSLQLCLLCCSVCSIIGTIFLNSIYMELIYSICLSLSDLLQSV